MIPSSVFFRAYLNDPDTAFAASRCGTLDINPDALVVAICHSLGAPRLMINMIFEERTPEEVVKRIRDLDS